MKTWSFGTNSLPEFRYGTLYITDEPWWIALLGWFADDVLGRICCSKYSPLYRIPLPNIFPRRRNEGSDELYTLQEWYGTLADVWHIFVYDPVFHFYWKYHHLHEIAVELGYDKLFELLGDKHANVFRTENEINCEEDEDETS